MGHNYYDCLSQLTCGTISNIDSGNWEGDYMYHDNGNMSSRTINSGTSTNFTYNGNQMDPASDGEVFDLDYDKNGNMKRKLVDAAMDTRLEYNWDGKLSYAQIGADSIDIRYDPRGNRVCKYSTVNGDKYYIVDIAGKLPTILCEIDPTDSSLKNSYIYANGQILCQYEGETDPNRHFYIHDRLGSVRLVINDAADVNNSYTYDSFGKLFATESTETTENPFKFTGQWFDSEIAQYYLRARQYDPQLMRFTGRDPVVGKYEEPLSLHMYLYCLNDPLNLVDPAGGRATALLAPIVAGYATHDLAIAVAAAAVWVDSDAMLDLGIAIERCILGVVSRVAGGYRYGKALVDTLQEFRGGKQKSRDRFGRIRDKYKLRDKGDWDSFRKFMHEWKKHMKIRGRDLTPEEMDECFQEWLFRKGS